MNMKEFLIAKIDNDIKKIGTNFGDYPNTTAPTYFDVPCLPMTHIFNWTAGFWPGMAYWAFKMTGDKKYVAWCEQFYQQYYDKVFVTPTETMHDLGFLYTPYAVAMYEATGEEKYKELGIQCAKVLAGRFVSEGNYIRAWGRMDNVIPEYVDEELAKNHFFTESEGLAIIDCMMNLPILFWASEASGDSYYRDIAVKHADTTMKYFIREDGSSCHAFRFNKDGSPIGEENYCGYDRDSDWARGTSWAIYGFAIAYAYTKKQEYLDTAVKLGEQFVDHLEEDFVPIWDFRLPVDRPAEGCGDCWNWDATDVENTKYNRDTSAAAVAVCGIYEILKHTTNEKLANAADAMFASLSEKYIEKDMNKDGILACQNGNMTYTNFGDYYFVEAYAMRNGDYKRLW